VYPALAIGAALEDGTTRVLFVGCRGKAEESIVPRQGMEIRFVRAAPYPGFRPGPRWVPFLWNLSLGTIKAAWILLRVRPDTVVATGGYVAAPTVFAAHALRTLRLIHLKLFIHEQNAAPGKLNLLMGRFADRVFLTFPESLRYFPHKGTVTGYPVRGAITATSREESARGLDFEVPAGRKVIFVFGGSQGARTLNRAVVDSLRELMPRAGELFVIHGTGLARPGGYDPAAETRGWMETRYSEQERERIASFYVSRDYFYDIQRVYALANLVVSRAGAGSLNEISAAGLPAVVVPKANLPGDHQVMNARSMQAAGAAVVLFEETVLKDGTPVESLDGALLAGTLLHLLDETTRLETLAQRSRDFMRPDAIARIRSLVEGGAAEKDGAPQTPQVPMLLSNSQLLSRLTSEKKRRGASYRPEDSVPDGADLPCYRARAASLLANPSWEARNMGVKLVGLLRMADKAPHLLAMLADRTPVPPFQRLLGGDFVQVGFIRRNILVSLRELGILDDAVESAIMRALADPYYEVRVEAARCAAFLAPNAKRKADFAVTLARLTKDPHWEVAAEAARALGEVGEGSETVRCLLGLAEHHFWQVREAGLAGLRRLIERGAAPDAGGLQPDLRRFILTSTDFKPHFAIKESYRRLREALDQEKG
jgi:UDP-N-acetylglucosamine--N-acetylmuramyl-(pentapeptide) pyrophosphoryl-undecaprenol N-acetylglucosamine transferase